MTSTNGRSTAKSIHQLLSILQKALVLMVPVAEELEIRWDTDTYDDWERLEVALFKAAVASPVDYMFEGDGFYPLGPYAAAGSDFSRSSLIVLDKPGPEMVFVALTTQSSPFDIAMFRALDGGHLDLQAEAMRVPLAHVQIAALERSSSVTLRISDILLT